MIMSTTISPAFRVPRDFDIVGFSRVARQKLTPALITNYYQETLANAVFTQDNFPNRSFKEVVLAELQDEGFEKDRHFNAAFYFYLNPVRDEVYVHLKGFPFEVIKLAKQLFSENDDYSYWNGSDSQLEYLSVAEWQDRGKAWLETIPVSGVNVNHVKVALFDDYMRHVHTAYKEFASVYENLDYPSEEKRVDRLLFSVYHDRLRESGFSYGFNDLMSAASRYFVDGVSALIAVDEYAEILEESSAYTSTLVSNNTRYAL